MRLIPKRRVEPSGVYSRSAMRGGTLKNYIKSRLAKIRLARKENLYV